MNSYMQQLANDIGLSPSLSLDDVDDLGLPDPSDMLLSAEGDCLMDDFPDSPDGVTSPRDCLLGADVMSDLSASPSMSLTSDMSLETFHQLEASLEAPDPNNNNDDNGGPGEERADRKEGVGARGRGGQKYSLRPRASKRRAEVMEIVRGRRRTPATLADDAEGKASGRAAGGRPKPRPPPLSKYRRKTANARERDRMREINAAFELLRRAVPVAAASTPSCYSPAGSPSPCMGRGPADSAAGGGGEKLTKITTLRLAMRYIAALSQLLQTTAPPDQSHAQHQAAAAAAAGYQLPSAQTASQLQGYGLAP